MELTNKWKWRRWYQRPLSHLRPESEKLSTFLSDRETFLKGAIEKDEKILFDEKTFSFDPETKIATANGYFPLPGWKEVAGTTLLWSAKIEGDKLFFRDELRAKIQTAKINLYLHGHSANPSVMRNGMNTEGQEKSVSLSLGLMGTEGTVKNDAVSDKEWPIDQVLETLNILGRDEDIINIVGHSMQGYTALLMASRKEVRDRFFNAKIIPMMPVVRGARYDTKKDTHVYLHAGVLGEIIKLLPIVDMMPTGARIMGMKGVNGLGIFSHVLGPIIRDKTISLLHYMEVSSQPKYLKRSNILLNQMDDLINNNATVNGLKDAKSEDRLEMVVGLKDRILNPKHMLALARLIGLEPKTYDDFSHYPHVWDWLKQVLKK